MNIRDYKHSKERRKALEGTLHISLDHIGTYSIDENLASTKHCENMIGAVQVPVGVAGPLQIQQNNKSYYIPLATTEGALVASISRGCKVITQSSGAVVDVEYVGVTRAPVFRAQGIQEAKHFVKWVEENITKLQEIAQTTSQHITLKKITPFFMGRNVYLRMQFDTQDAMGMNMATFATEAIVGYITQEVHIECISISGNMCVDKKPSSLNFIEGRGYMVRAEVTIPQALVEDVLKTTIQAFLETTQRKVLYGSALAGSLGYNAQYANVLAALFLATGQDLGHIAECAMGITTAEEVDGALYVSIYLPDVLLGTVGGGTELETQQESLKILGVENAKEFAVVVGGAVLAGEVSLLASLSNNTLGQAHKKLARKGTL